MRLLLTRTVPPVAQAVSLDDAKAQLRLSHTDDDAHLTALIEAATSFVEEVTGRALITQTWRVETGDLRARDVLEVMPAPVQSISAINFTDRDGQPQAATVADFDLYADEDRTFIRPAEGRAWPETAERPNATRVDYVVGYGDEASDVPRGLRIAIAMLVDFWFTRSSSLDGGAEEVPPSVRTLVGQYRLGWVSG